MPRYNSSFTLNIKDIELIEHALRGQISALSVHTWSSPETAPSDSCQFRQKIQELNELLGKIHNQKIFYGQVHHTGTPISG